MPPEGWPEALVTVASGARCRRDDQTIQPVPFAEDGGELTLRLPAREAAVPTTDPRGRDRATIDLPLPDRAAIHLPRAWNVGIVLDQDMPAGERYRAGLNYFGTFWLAYPLVLVDLGADGWLEVAARAPLEARGADRGGGGLLEHLTPLRPSAAVERTAGGFVLSFEWEASDPLTLHRWPSMEAAVANHHAWLRQAYGLRSIAARVHSGDLPAWVQDIPLVFTFDLWRPNGEVAHTYRHLHDFAREISALGVPAGTLFYLPGWCAPYDRGYPDYTPAPELGGCAGFRAAVEALHDAGYRIMVHTLAWGADPYQREFDRLAHLAIPARPHHSRNRLCGPYVGWPGGAPARPLADETGREPLRHVRPDAHGWSFETVALPEPCEATLTLGGLDWVRDGVVQVTVNGRTLLTPAGWFRDHETYTYPFSLRFHQGVNLAGIAFYGCPSNAGGAFTIAGDAPPNLGDAWYQLSGAVQFTGAWTAPIAGMDASAPEWQATYLARLAPTVDAFGIDAVHIDATLLWRWDEAGFFAAVQRRLPRTVFGSEAISAAGMRFFALGQGGQVTTDDPRGAWASKPSPLPWLITGEYMRVYQHLCGPRGFVPIGSSCNVHPVAAGLPEGDGERLRERLLRGRDLHVLYNLRLNYRDYGLDAGTRAFLLDHVVR